MTTSADLGLPFVAGQQAQPEVTHNEALVLIQALLQGVVDAGVNTPPAMPAEGDSYIVGDSPTGDWAGQANKIAIYHGGAWRFVPDVDSDGSNIAMGARHDGLRAWVRSEQGLYVWTGEGSPPVYGWRDLRPKFRGCLAYVGSTLSGADYTTEAAIPLDAELYDTDGFHDSGSNPSRLTVPAGVSMVRLAGAINCGAVAATGAARMRIRKNGTPGQPGEPVHEVEPTNTFRSALGTGALPVVPGDYFELTLLVPGDNSINVVSNITWLAIEVVA